MPCHARPRTTATALALPCTTAAALASLRSTATAATHTCLRNPFAMQDTVAEMASDMQKSRSGETATSAEELYRFMQRIR